MLSGFRRNPVRNPSDSAAKLLAKENEGLGLATEDLVAALRALEKEDPKANESIVKSPEIQAKAAANVERLKAYGGLGQRLDYEKSLGIISKDTLKGLIDYFDKYGPIGLPVVAGGAAVPVIRESGSSAEGL